MAMFIHLTYLISARSNSSSAQIVIEFSFQSEVCKPPDENSSIFSYCITFYWKEKYFPILCSWSVYLYSTKHAVKLFYMPSGLIIVQIKQLAFNYVDPNNSTFHFQTKVYTVQVKIVKINGCLNSVDSSSYLELNMLNVLHCKLKK